MSKDDANVTFRRKQVAIIRAAGQDGNDVQPEDLLQKNGCNIFVRAYEAMYRKPLASKYMNPEGLAELAWNAELLITQLYEVTREEELSGISGYDVVNGDNAVIKTIVDVLFKEGKRLLAEREMDGPSSPATSEATGRSSLPLLSMDTGAAPKNIAQQHRNLKKSEDKRKLLPSMRPSHMTSAEADSKEQRSVGRPLSPARLRADEKLAFLNEAGALEGDEDRYGRDNNNSADDGDGIPRSRNTGNSPRKTVNRKNKKTRGQASADHQETRALANGTAQSYKKLLTTLFDQGQEFGDRVKKRRKARKMAKEAVARPLAVTKGIERVEGRPMVLDAPPVLTMLGTPAGEREGYSEQGHGGSSSSAFLPFPPSDQVAPDGHPRTSGPRPKRIRTKNKVDANKIEGKSSRTNMSSGVPKDAAEPKASNKTSSLAAETKQEMKRAHTRHKHFMDRSESKRALIIKLSEKKLAAVKQSMKEMKVIDRLLRNEGNAAADEAKSKSKARDGSPSHRAMDKDDDKNELAMMAKLPGPYLGPPRTPSPPRSKRPGSPRDRTVRPHSAPAGRDGERGRRRRRRRAHSPHANRFLYYSPTTGRRQWCTREEVEERDRLQRRRKQIRSLTRRPEWRSLFLGAGHTSMEHGPGGKAGAYEFIWRKIEKMDMDELDRLVPSLDPALVMPATKCCLRPGSPDYQPPSPTRAEGQDPPDGTNRGYWPNERIEDSTQKWQKRAVADRLRHRILSGGSLSERERRALKKRQLALGNLGQTTMAGWDLNVSSRIKKKVFARNDSTVDMATPPPASLLNLYRTMQSHELVITIEYCHHCSWHNFSLRHKESQYRKQADEALAFLAQVCHREGVLARVGLGRFMATIPVKGAEPGTPHDRIGAFEIQAAYRMDKDCGGMARLLHSKIVGRHWPSLKPGGGLEQAFLSFLADAGVLTLVQVEKLIEADKSTVNVAKIVQHEGLTNVFEACPTVEWEGCPLAHPLWMCYNSSVPENLYYPDLRAQDAQNVSETKPQNGKELGECPVKWIFDLRSVPERLLESGKLGRQGKRRLQQFVDGELPDELRRRDMGTRSLGYRPRPPSAPARSLNRGQEKVMLDDDIEAFMTEEEHAGNDDGGGSGGGNREDDGVFQGSMAEVGGGDGVHVKVTIPEPTSGDLDDDADGYEIEEKEKEKMERRRDEDISNMSDDKKEHVNKGHETDSGSASEKEDKDWGRSNDGETSGDKSDRGAKIGDTAKDPDTNSSPENGNSDVAPVASLTAAQDAETDALIAALAQDSVSVGDTRENGNSESLIPRHDNNGDGNIETPADEKKVVSDEDGGQEDKKGENQQLDMGLAHQDVEYRGAPEGDHERIVSITCITASGAFLARPDFDECKVDISMSLVGKAVDLSTPLSGKTDARRDTRAFYTDWGKMNISADDMTTANVTVVLSAGVHVRLEGHFPMREFLQASQEDGISSDHFAAVVLCKGRLPQTMHSEKSGMVTATSQNKEQFMHIAGDAVARVVITGMANETLARKTQRMSLLNPAELAKMNFTRMGVLDSLDDDEDESENGGSESYEDDFT